MKTPLKIIQLGLIQAILTLAVSLNAQTLRYYKPGIKPTDFSNACLLLKKGDPNLAKLKPGEYYAQFNAVKLSGFDNVTFDSDSALKIVTDLCNPATLIFEKTDLSLLDKSLAGLTNLRFIYVTGECNLYENLFFPLIKDNRIMELNLEKREADIFHDSLALLADLSVIRVSDKSTFNKANHTETFQYMAKGNLHNLTIEYCGSFYKMEKSQAGANNGSKNPTLKTTQQSQHPAFIKQPVRNIHINDTVYKLNSLAKSKFTYKSGSIIQIDKKAFVTPTGKLYKGPVTLFYREFRTPVDILLSGIPMQVKSGDSTRVFKSAGMYEIKAFDQKGNPLQTVSDTSVKIKFAVTDTCGDYDFFSLEDDGTWVTTSTNVTMGPAISKNGKVMTRAVKEYLYCMRYRNLYKPDTMRFAARFESDAYLGLYRKDNMRKRRDSLYSIVHPSDHSLFNNKTRALFRIKYLMLTKDKKIVFTLVPGKAEIAGHVPYHISSLFNRTFIYEGTVSVAEFKRKYVQQHYYWDLRLSSANNQLEFLLKSNSRFISLQATAINLNTDKTYKVPKKLNATIGRIHAVTIKREERVFNKKPRYSWHNFNNRNGTIINPQLLAFEGCKKFQNEEEKKLNYREWVKYVYKNFGYGLYNQFTEDTEVGQALVKSGMGIKNIDEYIHSGQMEPIFVNYKNIHPDSVTADYCAMLYKSINTTYPLSRNVSNESHFTAFYFKNKPNYLIRFTDSGYMQVIKPSELESMKENDKLEPEYVNQYRITGLNSEQISKLIFDQE